MEIIGHSFPRWWTKLATHQLFTAHYIHSIVRFRTISYLLSV